VAVVVIVVLVRVVIAIFVIVTSLVAPPKEPPLPRILDPWTTEVGLGAKGG
jgi:hypothetical protein